MQETIVITGGAGCIGSAVGLLLAHSGYQVILLDTAFTPESITHLSWATLNMSDYGDKTALDDLFTTHRVTTVIHCAQSPNVSSSVIDPHHAYTSDLFKIITLLDRMRAHGISSIIFSSSAHVYGAQQIIPIAEYHPCNPLSPHGNIKSMIETILKDYDTAYGIKHVALRIFNTAGSIPEYQLPPSENDPLPSLIQSALTGQPFTLFGINHETHDGTYVRDYVHPLDSADAYLRAHAHLVGSNPSDCFNIGTGTGTSLRDLIHAVEKMYNTKIMIRHAAPISGEPPLLVADNSRARDILGWNPHYSMREYIIRSVHRSLIRKKPELQSMQRGQ
jgi:UDP-glucose-4-epimerase GalE